MEPHPTNKAEYPPGYLPSDYKCLGCGAHGVRLWRQYQTCADSIVLLCRPCAEEKQNEKLEPGSDHIGNLVPAIPVDGSFWGYTSVPQEGVEWWYSLPEYLSSAHEGVMADLKLLALEEENDRLRQERALVLDVKTKEGLTASEWLLRTAKAEDLLEKIREAAYIEDCHISGSHDPLHTPHRICELQLRELAERITAVLFGVDWDNRVPEELNKIPRKINRKGWYAYFVEKGPTQRVVELERWERDGIVSKEEK